LNGDIAACVSVANVLQSVLDSNRIAFEAVSYVFDVLFRFVEKQNKNMFKTDLKLETSKFVTSVLKMCSFTSPSIRAEATAFVYLLILQNLKCVGNFDTVKNISVLACSRLAEEKKDFGGNALQNSLNSICQYALNDLYIPATEGLIDLVVLFVLID
jgi:hypothetical protein